MYGYYEHINITPEQLLQKLDQIKVFELVFNQPIDLNKKYLSPFRKDRVAKCYFSVRDDSTIIFVDYGDRRGTIRRSCLRAVMDIFSLSLKETIDFLCVKYNLSTNSADYLPTSNYVNNTETEKQETVITFDKRAYTKKDKLYWSQSLITVDNLEEDNVPAISKYKKVNQKSTLLFTPYNISYALDFIHHVKIYNPLNNKDYKWLTNCDEDDIGNIDNLSATGDRLIITKSYKDHRTIRNTIEPNTVWFQNEGCVPSIYILKNLLERFTEVVIFFDNDFTGIREGYKMYNILKVLKPDSIVKLKYIPIDSKHKDPAEYAREGRNDLMKMYKQIEL